jgi:flagellar M-ring protein FliF
MGNQATVTMNQWAERLRDWWGRTTSTQRLRLLAGILVGLAAVVILSNLAFSPNWQPLYTNLSAAQAGQITNQLAQMKVPYQLAQGGRTVLVPSAQVDQTRVALADQNIPSSGTVGFANLTQFSLGETDQELQLTEQVALQDELASTIASINAVTAAKVFLNEPSPSLFGQSQNPTTASVFVTLKPYQTLTTSQVRGIMQLVSHAVAGLSLKHVSVVDQNGTLLSAGVLASSSTLSGQATTQFQAEQAVDAAVEQSVQTLLAQVLGPGQAVVRVTSVLNFASQTVKSQVTGKPVVSQSETETQSSTGAAVATGGGAGANTPGYVAGATTPTSSKSTTVIQHFTVPVSTTTTVTPAGGIQRLSVAVAVSRKLSPALQTALSKLVAQAAGLNPKRGDTLTLVGIPFNTSAARTAASEMAQAARVAQYEQWGEELLLVVLAALILRAAWGAVRRWQAAPRPALATAGAVPPAGEDVTQSVASLLRQMAESKPTPGDRAVRQVSGLIKDDPATVARLLRSWMAEED